MNKIKNLIATMFNAEKKNKENKYILSGLHFTTNHTGKMTGMYSLSTSCKSNYHCVERSKIENSICHECYAITMSNNYSSLDKCLVRNTEILTGSIIDFDKLPFINAHSFRFESFGDLNNAIQVINYFNICNKNPFVNFAIWTKNPVYINVGRARSCRFRPMAKMLWGCNNAEPCVKVSGAFVECLNGVAWEKYQPQNKRALKRLLERVLAFPLSISKGATHKTTLLSARFCLMRCYQTTRQMACFQAF